MSTLEELQSVIDKSKRIVFFGGAGVSTESGIPDFRSVDGLYNQKYDYPPEQILSHTFFVHKTSEFFRFYRDKMLCLDKSRTRRTISLQSLKRRENFRLLSPKTLTDFIRRQAVSVFMSCTEAFFATTAQSAAGSMTQSLSRTLPIFPNVPAEVS